VLEVVLGEPEAVIPEPFGKLSAGEQFAVGVVDGALAISAVERWRPGQPGVGHLDAAEHEYPDAHGPSPSGDVDLVNIVRASRHVSVSPVFRPR
jgi:hypothetical protein